MPVDILKLDNALLREIPFFAELTPDELDEVRRFCTVKRYRKGAMVFIDGEDYAGMFVVLKGSVKVYKNSPEGKEYVVHVFHAMGQFADVPMFAGGRFPANAQVMEAASLLFIPKRELSAYIERHPALMRKMLVGFAKKIRELAQQLEDLTLHDVGCRLARYLVREISTRKRDALPQPFLRLPVSKSVLAAHLGTTIETLSRTFHKLQIDRILHVQQRTITVTDLARLRVLAM